MDALAELMGSSKPRSGGASWTCPKCGAELNSLAGGPAFDDACQHHLSECRGR